MSKTFLTWQEYMETLHMLTYRLMTMDKHQFVTGIPRGGLPIAVYVSHQLGIPYVHMGEAARQILLGHRVIICDDILETGETAQKYGATLSKLNCTFAVLINKECPIMDPDVCGAIMPADKWIVFPYEKEGR